LLAVTGALLLAIVLCDSEATGVARRIEW
jgi:hypothetical protein